VYVHPPICPLELSADLNRDCRVIFRDARDSSLMINTAASFDRM